MTGSREMNYDLLLEVFRGSTGTYSTQRQPAGLEVDIYTRSVWRQTCWSINVAFTGTEDNPPTHYYKECLGFCVTYKCHGLNLFDSVTLCSLWQLINHQSDWLARTTRYHQKGLAPGPYIFLISWPRKLRMP